MEKIGFGGSCHWCTEAIFLSLTGVTKVDQGWIASTGDATAFSEAVIVYFDECIISLQTLTKIHLYTHSCTSAHTMRSKYRSAVYTVNASQSLLVRKAIDQIQPEFDSPIITTTLPLLEFKLNTENYQNYYFKSPDKPFCENIVNPKLKSLMEEFSEHVDLKKLAHLENR